MNCAVSSPSTAREDNKKSEDNKEWTIRSEFQKAAASS
jgi:hypothetical protein